MSAAIPESIFLPVRPDPEPAPAVKVCARCRKKAMRYAFSVNGAEVATYHCPEHGDIVPITSRYWRD